MNRLFAQAGQDRLSYLDVGATEHEALPVGYHHVSVERRIGDVAVFNRAVVGLRTWAAHEGAGMKIFPAGQPVTAGSTIVSVASFGPLTMVAPCRITRVIDGPDTFGFTYGTLPGHPESGEEAFVLERRTDGTYFRITAFSKPVDLLARLAGPVGTLVQRAATRGYVRALTRFVKTAPSSGDGGWN